MTWTWELTLTGLGNENGVHPVGAATRAASNNRIEYRRPELIEWYVNSEEGLEQGFTLHRPPSPPDGRDVVLQLTLGGDVRGALDASSGSIELLSAGGVRVLDFGRLRTVDATGLELPTHFVLADNHLDIVVAAGEAVYPIVVDPLATSPAWTAESNQAGAELGWSVATAGDVNGDGYGDVIVGVPIFDNGETDEGRACLFLGGSSGLGASPAWTAESNQTGAELGISVATAGDVNGDGFSDVIVGAHKFDRGETNEGRVYLYVGGPTGLAASPAWTAESNQIGAQLGWSVATPGDVNGDGFSDVIVGALGFDSGQTDEGRAFLYLGGPAGLAASPAWTAESNQVGASLGSSVAMAGDVNSDGYSDVIVGAFGFDNGQTDEGRAFLYLGGPAGLAASPAWTAESNQVGAQLGWSVATAGDVNGDGYSDVIVGALGFDNGQTDEGRAFLYLGGSAGLAASPAWTAESNQVGASLGSSVAMAGDVNGDGYSDVIVGAFGFDNGQTVEGRAFLYLGGPMGLAPNP
ncbi:MAG: integrin alpha, partial [Thermodesulfobacteriota bacterium]